MCPLAQFEPNCGEKELFDELFKAYENWKDALGKIDYDDMLLKAYELMKNDKTCLEWLQERYQYIQIDEFQDTNYLQRDILYLLAGENGNIAVVGDDDQSIYGFRGAKPEIMLKFAEHYPNACLLYTSDRHHRRQYGSYRRKHHVRQCISNCLRCKISAAADSTRCDGGKRTGTRQGRRFFQQVLTKEREGNL